MGVEWKGNYCFPRRWMLIRCKIIVQESLSITSKCSSKFSLIYCFRYGSCATPRDFEIYAPNASFEDPLMCAHGYANLVVLLVE